MCTGSSKEDLLLMSHTFPYKKASRRSDVNFLSSGIPSGDRRSLLEHPAHHLVSRVSRSQRHHVFAIQLHRCSEAVSERQWLTTNFTLQPPSPNLKSPAERSAPSMPSVSETGCTSTSYIQLTNTKWSRDRHGMPKTCWFFTEPRTGSQTVKEYASSLHVKIGVTGFLVVNLGHIVSLSAVLMFRDIRRQEWVLNPLA